MKPKKSSLANARIEFFNEEDQEFLIDGFVDQDDVELIEIYVRAGKEWVSVDIEDTFDDLDLDRIREKCIIEYNSSQEWLDENDDEENDLLEGI
jgi:hypothetical protein